MQTNAGKKQNRYLTWFHGLFESDMFTYKEIRNIFVPLLMDQLFIHIINILAVSLVSSVGEAAMAAVSMVNTMGFIVTTMFSALSLGGGIVIAQAKGSGDYKKLRNAVSEMTALCFIFTLFTSVGMFVFAEPIIRLIYPKAEPILIEYAVEFMKLMSISQIPFCIFNAIFTAFRSVGDAKSSLVLTIAINVLHLLLSLLFINGMGLGVRGSGYSFIVARTLGFIVAVIWILRPSGMLHMKLKDFFHPRFQYTKEIVRLGFPAGVEQILFQSGMVMVQGYLSGWGDTPAMGTLALAAHAVASSVFNLFNCVGFTIAGLGSTVCGQCIGARRMDLFKMYTRSLIKGGRIVLLAAECILIPLTPLVLKLYHPNPDAVGMIYQMILIAAIPMPFIWCNGFVTVNTLRATGDSAFPTVVALVSLLFGRVMIGYFLTITCNMGPVGIWISNMLEWVARAVSMEWRFRSEKWMKYVKRSWGEEQKV